MERLRGWHVLKLEFWHVPHPELNLHCVFASFFLRCFLTKSFPPGGLHCTKKTELSLSHRFFGVLYVYRISHRLLVVVVVVVVVFVVR